MLLIYRIIGWSSRFRNFTQSTHKAILTLLNIENINKRDYICTLLALVACFAYNFWKFYETSDIGGEDVNWFILKQPVDTLPTLRWYLRMLGICITLVSFSAIFLILSRMRQWLRVVAVCVTVFFSIDLVMFFVCFNHVTDLGNYFITLCVLTHQVYKKTLAPKYKRTLPVSFDGEEGKYAEVRTVKETQPS